MFSWPFNCYNDRMSARRQPTLMPGKQPYLRQWKLDLTVSSGFMTKDNIWIPASDTAVAWPDQVQLSIVLDKTVVGQHQVGTEQHTMTHWLPDSDVLVENELCVNISGLQANGVIDDYHPMLLISMSIENISMDKIIELTAEYHIWQTKEIKQGTQYLGQDGKLILRVCGPIYVWLMNQIGQITPYKHHKLFQNKLFQKV